MIQISEKNGTCSAFSKVSSVKKRYMVNLWYNIFFNVNESYANYS